MSRKSRYSTRARLFIAQNGLCHWCGELMILAKGHPDALLEPKFCTADHLIDRWDAPFRDKAVAACFECNQKRNDAKQAQVPKEEKWARCGGPPKRAVAA